MLNQKARAYSLRIINLKGNQAWIFIGRTDIEVKAQYFDAEAPIFWLPNSKSWLTEKDPDAMKDWGQEKRVTEDEMVGSLDQPKGTWA